MKKGFARLVAACLMLSAAVAVASCQKTGPTETATIKLDRSRLNMTVGAELKLVAKAKGTDLTVEWSSDDETIAMVSQDGIVTGIKAGTAVITAAAGEASDKCMVSVEELDAEMTVYINGKEAESSAYRIALGESVQISAGFFENDEDVTDKVSSVTFTSGNEAIAEVQEDGTVNFLTAGDVDITVKGAGKQKTVRLTVMSLGFDDLKNPDGTFNADSDIFMQVSDRLTLNVTLLPDGLAAEKDRKLEWTVYPAENGTAPISITPSKDGSSVEISALQAGEAIIRVRNISGIVSTERKVTVSDFTADRGEIRKNDGSVLQTEVLGMNAGEELTVTAAFYKSEDGNEEEVTTKVTPVWTSSDSGKVKVEKGEYGTVIKALKRSDEPVTVSVEGAGVTVSFKVTVTQPVESITVEPEVVRLKIDESISYGVGTDSGVKAVVLPEDANDKAVSWKIQEGTDCVILEDGIIKAAANGTALIFASAGGKVASFKVEVGDTQSSQWRVTISPDTDVILERTGTTGFTASVSAPEAAPGYTVNWKTMDESIAEIDAEGRLTAKSQGETSVYCSVISDGINVALSNQVNVKVGPLKPTSIVLSETEKAIGTDADESFDLKATVYPEDADARTIIWKSSDVTAATVDNNGHVTPVSSGIATITAYVEGYEDIKATCKVTVGTPVLTGIQIVQNRNINYVDVGATLQLDYTLEPDGIVAGNTPVWSSSDNAYATVDQNGMVSGIGYDPQNYPTPVTISCTMDGVTGSYDVNVYAIQPTSVSFTEVPTTVKLNSKTALSAKMAPEAAYDVAEIIWQLQDGRFAGDYLNTSIGNDVVFEAKETGTFRFMVRAKDNGQKMMRSELYNSVYALRSLYVEPYFVTGFSLGMDSYVMEMGSGLEFVVTWTSDVNGVEPSDKTLMWESSDKNVATVDNGKITTTGIGKTTISAISTSTKDGKALTRTCEIEVKAKSSSSASVGDYFYSDGTWSSTLDKEKTPVGIVFALFDPTVSDALLKKDYPECTHGLVIGLNEYSSPFIDSADYGYSMLTQRSWMTENGYSMAYNTSVDCGYSNTLGWKACNANTDYKVSCVKEDEDHALYKQTAAVPLPEGVSSWYWPSAYECFRLSESWESINAGLLAAGGTAMTSTSGRYLSSTLNYDSWADKVYVFPVIVSSGGFGTQAVSTDSIPVRFIFAF